MHRLFSGSLAQHVFAERPPDGFGAPLQERWASQVAKLAARRAPELAAIIVEPVVQGAGGMRFYSPACIGWLRELCDRHGLLLVLDEIATGFGRTGSLFACEYAGVAPDVMCLGKALTGGYLSLAATLCTRAVADAVSSGEGRALMHGPTYMANPLACAVGLASTGLLAEGRWRAEVPRIERGLREGLAGAWELPGVVDVRVLGAIGVVQMKDSLDVGAATRAAIERGVWLRPFRDLVYTMPAYVMDDEDLAAVGAAVLAAARAGRAERTLVDG
jgi:adenosylmethionine-8-amino-7-oxononanoate aminotransferase